MRRFRFGWSPGPSRVAVATLACCACACATAGADPRPPRVAVLSAFPAELAPLLERAAIEETLVIGNRSFRVGMLEGVPVVLAMTGIGMVNAEQVARTLLERFEVVGVVVSGVAGSRRRIGDVDVPRTWSMKDGSGSWTADSGWLEIARQLEAPGALRLERCTTLAGGGSEERICVDHEPALAVGGVGRSGDSFGGEVYPCDPDGDEVSGCDVAPEARRPPYDPRSMPSLSSSSSKPATEAGTFDMETAAIGREAAARGLPYIAFRAASDGEGDPLGLPGFPAQFYAYYRLAARNAAAATRAFLGRLPQGQGVPAPPAPR